MTQMVADGLHRTKELNSTTEKAVCSISKPIKKRTKINSDDWSTEISGNKIFHRHGTKFKKLLKI